MPRTTGLKTLIPLAAWAVLFNMASCSERDVPAAGGSPAQADRIGNALVYDPSEPVNGGRPVVLEFWSQVDYETVYGALLEDYVDLHPNVEIHLSSLSWDDHRTRLYAALEAGIGPDLIHLHNSMSSRIIPHLQPYPRERFPLDALERDFRQVRSHLVDGHLYFIDIGLMTGAIFYNRAHWAEAGLDDTDIPSTWEDLAGLGRLLTVRGGDGSVIRSGFNPNGMGFALLTALNLQQGIPMFSLSEPRRPLIATPESQRSLEYLRSFYVEPAVVDPYLPEAHESFGFGTSSMIYAWGWTMNWLDTNAPHIDYGTFPLPSWDGTPPPAYDRNNGEISMGVNRYSDPDEQQAAFDVVAFYLANDDYLLDASSRFGTFPAKISLEHHGGVKGNSRLDAFRAILERTIWPGALPQTYEEHIAQYVIDPVVLDGADVATALVTGDRIITPVMRYEEFLSRERHYGLIDEFQTDYTILR